MRKNHMQEIAKFLGVELGENFIAVTSCNGDDEEAVDVCCLCEGGLLFGTDEESAAGVDNEILLGILLGEIGVRKLPEGGSK